MPLPWLEGELAELAARNLLRSPLTLEGPTGPEVVIDGRPVLCLCSNDYLGLAAHPAVVEAARDALGVAGFGACSSRLISGTNALHRRLEDRLAAWLRVERALLFPAGFMANLAVLSTLAGPGDVILSDELNHASIVHGCRLSRARVEVYPHGDLEVLAERLHHAHGARRTLVVTDALFSVDGDEADVARLAALAAAHPAALVVDEAHSLGALGPGGRGLCAAAGVAPDVLVGTLGKAFGCAGAFVAGSAALIRTLESRAAPFIYTTAPPPALAAAALAALEIVERADDDRARLAALAAGLRDALARRGARIPARARRHIVPVAAPGAAVALAASAELLRRGVFVQALRPPTVAPGTERLRWTVTSRHAAEHLARAADAYAAAQSVPGTGGSP